MFGLPQLLRNAPSIVVVFTAALAGQATHPSQPPGASSDAGQGKQVFSSTCGGCHGLDGRGGERAPNIADRPTVERLSDARISGIIRHGVPGTGMPAFQSLTGSEVKAVVAYLRTLQGAKRTTALPGDPARGRAVFFGKAGCSRCHMVAGEGGFIASDLSAYGHVHEIEQIRSAIVSSSGPEQPVRLVTITMHSGERYTGRVRNEDNFSLQMQSLDGAYHFITKSEIEQLEYDSKPLMPSDYGTTLNPAELNDLVSYLIKVAGPTDSPAKKSGDWEEP
jgi:cytochrome c oxidase cbb3-type subunit III